MDISVDRLDGGVVVTRVSGRLDFASAQAARNEFDAAIAVGQPKIIVDLSEIAFVDSAGLGALIGGMRAARQAGGDLYLVNPSVQARTLLSLTSLDQLLKVHQTVEEALESFA
jgi:anti-sigma B factor antagonist